MHFTVITIFPDMFESVLDVGILGKARAAGKITVDFVDPRDFTSDRHRTVDDAPYGGGPGMVMKVGPLMDAIEAACADRPSHRILLTPAGAPLTQSRLRELSQRTHLVLVCGRYEGIDERVSELGIDEELSIGDYVLTGGELAAMVIIDGVSRYVPEVLGESSSTEEESFSESLLEYPQYTRPSSYRGHDVPEVLLSGNHARIARWRRARALSRTAQRRPDLLARHHFSDVDRELRPQTEAAPATELARRTYVALVHHPVYDRNRRIVTSAITNLDLHDIARSVATYGLAGYLVVTPVAAQREKVDRILSVWRETVPGADNRVDALAGVAARTSIADARAYVADETGRRPWVVATSARPTQGAVEYGALQEVAADESSRPILLLFGTGWGLAESVIHESDQVLTPIRGHGEFNHLSVRSAVAIILDRLFGAAGRPTGLTCESLSGK